MGYATSEGQALYSTAMYHGARSEARQLRTLTWHMHWMYSQSASFCGWSPRCGTGATPNQWKLASNPSMKVLKYKLFLERPLDRSFVRWPVRVSIYSIMRLWMLLRVRAWGGGSEKQGSESVCWPSGVRKGFGHWLKFKKRSVRVKDGLR